MTETTDTALSTEALVAWLAEQTWSDFAQSLASYHGAKGYLTPNQEAAGRKMKATCDAKAAAKAKAAGGEKVEKVQAEVGLYLLDGEVYKVRWNRAKTQRYAKRLVGPKSWDYAAGKVYELTPDHRVTAEIASDYGASKGHCINCGLEIGYGEDQRAVMVGYGSTCAKNNGWPFPSKAELDAFLLTGDANATNTQKLTVSQVVESW